MSDEFDPHKSLTTEEAVPYVVTNLGIQKHATKTALYRLLDSRAVQPKKGLAEVLWVATQEMEKAVAAAQKIVLEAREALHEKKPLHIDPTVAASIQSPEFYIEKAIEERKTEEGRYNQGRMYAEIDEHSKGTNSLNDSKLINGTVEKLQQLDASADKLKKLTLKLSAMAAKAEANGSGVSGVVNGPLKNLISPETAEELKKLELPEFAAVLWAAKTAKEAAEKRHAPTNKSTHSSFDDLLDGIDDLLANNPVAIIKPVADTHSDVERFITRALHPDPEIEDRAAQIDDLNRAKRLKALGGGIKTDEDAVKKAIESLTHTPSQARLAG